MQGEQEFFGGRDEFAGIEIEPAAFAADAGDELPVFAIESVLDQEARTVGASSASSRVTRNSSSNPTSRK